MPVGRDDARRGSSSGDSSKGFDMGPTSTGRSLVVLLQLGAWRSASMVSHIAAFNLC